MNFVWKRCINYDEIKTLFESVIYEEDRFDINTMLTSNPDKFRGYCTTVDWLSKTQTLLYN